VERVSEKTSYETVWKMSSGCDGDLRSVLAKIWAEGWAKEGKEVVDWQRLIPPQGFRVLPRRWAVERTFAWISHGRRTDKDYERLCASGEAFVYAAMRRLMARRLARA
jgi:Transposase DDE domain